MLEMYENMKNRISNAQLRALCVKNNWFTEGASSHYEKLFEMNEYGAS